eukprot:6468447-Amphidinium_carterae.1
MEPQPLVQRAVTGFAIARMNWRRALTILDIVPDPEMCFGHLEYKRLSTDLDFTVKSGDLLALVGKEGQGKSSVFAAMLGELAVVNGSAFSPAFGRCSHEQANPLQLPVSTAEELEGQEAVADGPLDPSLTVSYKSQDPAIVTGSVRSNVIFSANYNETLYKK